jgi:hypothetical protein
MGKTKDGETGREGEGERGRRGEGEKGREGEVFITGDLTDLISPSNLNAD